MVVIPAPPQDEPKVDLRVPKRAAALLQRVMALGPGLHEITILKNRTGAGGIQCWSVDASSKIETTQQ